jgi:MoxR-like ATPase
MTLTLATDREITALVERLAELNGSGFIKPSTTYSPAMRDTAKQLLLGLGATEEQFRQLPDNDLTAFYAIARKSPAGGRNMVAKHFRRSPLEAPRAPYIAPDAPAPLMSPEALQELTERMLETARRYAEETAQLTVDQALVGIPATVAATLAKLTPRRVEITREEDPEYLVKIDQAHKSLEEVLHWAEARIWPFLVGPAGSGKTTLAKQVADALSLPFAFAAKVDSKFDLLGFMNARGEYVRTLFRDCYEFGGCFLLDEMDGSNANALNAFNAALDNGICPFPDKVVPMHHNFIAIGAGNTFGGGGDPVYVGRTQLDAATLNRFTMIKIDYDEELERSITRCPEFTKYIQALRKEVTSRSWRYVVSPRASIKGGEMVAQGKLSWEQIANGLVFNAMKAADKIQLQNAVPMSDYQISIL